MCVCVSVGVHVRVRVRVRVRARVRVCGGVVRELPRVYYSYVVAHLDYSLPHLAEDIPFFNHSRHL